MAPHYSWQKNEDLGDEFRDLFDPSSPLPRDVEFTPASAAIGCGTKITAAIAVFLGGFSVFIVLVPYFDPAAATGPGWLRWLAAGVAFAIAGVVAMSVYDRWQVTRAILAGEARYGEFFTPAAFIQRGTERTRVLREEFIDRFEKQFVRTESRGHDRAYAVVDDGGKKVAVEVPGIGHEVGDAIRRYEAWRTRARQARRRS